MYKKKGILISCTVGLLLIFLVVLFTQKTSTSSVSHESNKETKQMLDKGKWAPDNYKAIQKLIEEHGDESPNYDPDKKPYAVFDWDNTNIMNDTQEALLIYQIDHLKFNMTPEEFAKVIKTGVPEGPLSEQNKNEAGKRIEFKAITSDLEQDYQYLYDQFENLGGSKKLKEVTNTNEFKDFKVKLLFLYDAIIETHGSDIGYPWVAYLFTNMTVEEIKELTEDSNDYSLGDKLSDVTMKSPETLPGKAGAVETSYVTGIRVKPEMSNLMNTLRDHGIDTYVVSASMEEVVEVFASDPKYGYNFEADKVIGLRYQTKNGKIQPKYQEDWPLTVYDGKTKVIKQEIAKGYDPILIAGDSDGDYEMLTDFSGLQLGLIINRISDGNIGKLSEKAAKEIGKDDVKYILQGRDENTGLFIPSEETLKNNAKEKQLLHD